MGKGICGQIFKLAGLITAAGQSGPDMLVIRADAAVTAQKQKIADEQTLDAAPAMRALLPCTMTV